MHKLLDIKILCICARTDCTWGDHRTAFVAEMAVQGQEMKKKKMTKDGSAFGAIAVPIRAGFYTLAHIFARQLNIKYPFLRFDADVARRSLGHPSTMNKATLDRQSPTYQTRRDMRSPPNTAMYTER